MSVLEPKVPFWKHQAKAVHQAVSRKYYGLFFEMGTGKSATIINILRNIFNDQIHKTLILCPPIVVENWVEEFQKHSDFKVITVRGTGVKRAQIIQDNMDKNTILITNYETLNMKEARETLFRFKPQVLICDESHKLKSGRSKRTKYCVQLSKISEYRYILTGTPTPNSLMDIFYQMLILDRGQRFGKYVTHFRSKYFIDKNAHVVRFKNFPEWVLRSGAKEEILSKVEDSGMSIKKEECLDLPPLITKTLKCEMAPDQKKAYKSLKKDLVAELSGGFVVGDLAVTKILRLMQIASGYVPLERDINGKVKIYEFRNPKIAALEEYLESIPENSKVGYLSCFPKFKITRSFKSSSISSLIIFAIKTSPDRKKSDRSLDNA